MPDTVQTTTSTIEASSQQSHSCGICKKQRHEILFKIKSSTLTSTIPFVNKKKDKKSSVYCLVGSNGAVPKWPAPFWVHFLDRGVTWSIIGASTLKDLDCLWTCMCHVTSLQQSPLLKPESRGLTNTPRHGQTDLDTQRRHWLYTQDINTTMNFDVEQKDKRISHRTRLLFKIFYHLQRTS